MGLGKDWWWPFMFLRQAMLVPWRRQWHPSPVLLPGKSHGWRSLVGYSPWGCEEWDTSWTRLSNFTFTFHFHALEKEMATHSSVLAWRIPGTGEPGSLPSMGSHRVGHDWSNLAAAAACWPETQVAIYSYLFIFFPPGCLSIKYQYHLACTWHILWTE